MSESLKSGSKLPCSEFVLAVGHNAARKWPPVASRVTTLLCAKPVSDLLNITAGQIEL